MNRILLAAGLALAFHAGLFWWGRDWEWLPALPPGTEPGALNLELAVLPAPAAHKENPAAAVAESSLPPEDKAKAVIRAKSPSRQMEEAESPEIAPHPETDERARELPPSISSADLAARAPEPEKPKPAENLEPVPPASANDQAFTEPSRDPAVEPPGYLGRDHNQPENHLQETVAASGGDTGISAARPLYRINPPPSYPPAARRRHYQGTVLLDVMVDEEGRVDELRVASSSGYPLLDRAALNGVRRWRFEPGRRGREKIAMWVQVPVRFVLD